MAAPGFGFSVGDIIDGISLIRKLIRALNGAAGSRKAYRKLMSELLNLEDVLTETSKLELCPARESQQLALQRVATECQNSIKGFLKKNFKFKESLGSPPSATPPTWWTNLHKLQWALCKDNAIDDLRAEIAVHTATLNLCLATINATSSKSQEQSLDNCTLLLQAVCDETKEAKARAEQSQQTLTVHTGLLETISRTVTGLMFGTQENGLLSLALKGLQWNIRIFDTILQVQQLLIIKCSTAN